MTCPISSAVMDADSIYSVTIPFIITLKHVDVLKLKQDPELCLY